MRCVGWVGLRRVAGNGISARFARCGVGASGLGDACVLGCFGVGDVRRCGMGGGVADFGAELAGGDISQVLIRPRNGVRQVEDVRMQRTA